MLTVTARKYISVRQKTNSNGIFYDYKMSINSTDLSKCIFVVKYSSVKREIMMCTPFYNAGSKFCKLRLE